MTTILFHKNRRKLYWCPAYWSDDISTDCYDPISSSIETIQNTDLAAIDYSDTFINFPELVEDYYRINYICVGQSVSIHIPEDRNGVFSGKEIARGTQGVVFRIIGTGAGRIVEVKLAEDQTPNEEDNSVKVGWEYVYFDSTSIKKSEVFLKSDGITVGCYVECTSTNSPVKRGTVLAIGPLQIQCEEGSYCCDEEPVKKCIGKYVAYEQEIHKVISSNESADTATIQDIYGTRRVSNISSNQFKSLSPENDKDLDYIFDTYSSSKQFLIYHNETYSYVSIYSLYLVEDGPTIRLEVAHTNNHIANTFTNRRSFYVNISFVCKDKIFCTEELNVNNKDSISKLIRAVYGTHKNWCRNIKVREIILAKRRLKNNIQKVINCTDQYDIQDLCNKIQNHMEDVYEASNIAAEIKAEDKLSVKRDGLFKDILFLIDPDNEFDERVASVKASLIILPSDSFLKLSVTTDSITLYHRQTTAEIGQLVINLIIKIKRNGSICAQTKVEQVPHSCGKDINGYYHPHVGSEGAVCFGDYDEKYSNCLDDGNIIGALDILLGILNTYNSRSPYVALEEWDENSNTCEECGEVCDRDSLHSCDDGFKCGDCTDECYCGETICGCCSIQCNVCDKRVCSSCNTYCEECNSDVCNNCFGERDCGHRVCDNCIDRCYVCRNTICSSCIISCYECGNSICEECANQCELCDRPICKKCEENCEICGKAVCSRCHTECEVCEDIICKDCIHKCPECNRKVCGICRELKDCCSEKVNEIPVLV